MTKKQQQHRAEADVHLCLGPNTVRDHAASADSCVIDAAADRQWFHDHPNTTERERPASPREIAALGLPHDTMVLVICDAHGQQARVFLCPQPRRN